MSEEKVSKIPRKVAETDLSRELRQFLPRKSQGKVRDMYELPDHAGFLLQVATDRISALDVVLPNLIPDKGYILTKLTVFWSTEVLDVKDHLVAWGQGIDEFLPQELQGDPDLQRRGIVIREAKVQPFELIFRYHLGGSVYKDYAKTRVVAGFEYPKGLKKWSKLSEPAFTPSTKAQDGHDVNITVRKYYEGIDNNFRAWSTQNAGTAAYKRGYEFARGKGILILDTKFEYEDSDLPMLLDEILTPDSSRFTPEDDWHKAMEEGRDPIFMDKEPVRVYLRSVVMPFFYLEDEDGHKKGDPIAGLQNLNLKNREEREWAQEVFTLPSWLIAQTSQLYRTIDERLTGQALWPV